VTNTMKHLTYLHIVRNNKNSGYQPPPKRMVAHN